MYTPQKYLTPSSRRSSTHKQITFTNFPSSKKADCNFHIGSFAPTHSLFPNNSATHQSQTDHQKSVYNRTMPLFRNTINPERTTIQLKPRLSLYQRDVMRKREGTNCSTQKKMGEKYPQTPQSWKKEQWERESCSTMKRRAKYITVISRMPVNKRLFAQSLC